MSFSASASMARFLLSLQIGAFDLDESAALVRHPACEFSDTAGQIEESVFVLVECSAALSVHVHYCELVQGRDAEQRVADDETVVQECEGFVRVHGDKPQ